MNIKQISPKEAFELVLKNKNSLIIDVRTMEEVRFVGFIDAEAVEERIIIIPLKLYPKMENNPDFVSGLTSIFDRAFGSANRKDFSLIFICRSGARSQEAAELFSTLGFASCYNVTGGFEGDLDKNKHRGTINGWKFENLPWKQQ